MAQYLRPNSWLFCPTVQINQTVVGTQRLEKILSLPCFCFCLVFVVVSDDGDDPIDNYVQDDDQNDDEDQENEDQENEDLGTSKNR